MLSVTLDNWTPLQLRMMELGGNERWNEFLKKQGIPEDLPIRDKYSTRAAAWYRANLRALAEGSEPPLPLPPGTGHLPIQDAPNTTLAVLDQVFSSVDCGDGLKRDAIMAAVVLKARADALERKRQSSNTPEWLCQQLQLLLQEVLLISEGDRAAWRLKEMSTGKMTGFGDCRCTAFDLPELEPLTGEVHCVEATRC